MRKVIWRKVQRLREQKGTAVTECMLILPVALLGIIAVVALAVTGVRAIVTQHAANRVARVAEVFQEDFAQAELVASLPPQLFSGGAFALEGSLGMPRSSNAVRGELSATALSNGALGHALGGSLAVKRRSPIAPALPEGLSNRIVRGGDVPSPYCRAEGGYRVCGYPD